MNIVAICRGCKQELAIINEDDDGFDTEKCPRCIGPVYIGESSHGSIWSMEPGVQIIDKDLHERLKAKGWRK